MFKEQSLCPGLFVAPRKTEVITFPNDKDVFEVDVGKYHTWLHRLGHTKNIT